MALPVARGNDAELADVSNPVAQINLLNVANPAATASATLVQSGNFVAGGNLTINTAVNNTQSPSASRVSRWLAEIAAINQYAIHKETYDKVTSGTCSWILEEPKFEAWMSGGPGTFWGVGIPGAGKTILSSFVIRHLQKRVETPGSNTLVSFAYCRYNDSLSVSQILAWLLQQLVNSSALVERHVRAGLFATCSEDNTKPTKSELQSTLSECMGLVPRVFIVVDALDELQEDVREGLISVLLQLRQPMFLTSRELHLRGIPRHDIRIKAPERDFETFISSEIQRFPKLGFLLDKRKDILDEVVHAIRSKSDGMFLLSALQVAALGSVTTIKSLRKAVEDLPTTLADMYKMTVARIMALSEEERSLALRAILWVTYAAEPLKSRELLAALAVDPNSTELDPDAISEERTLVSVCCGLLTVNKETAGVRLIHYTTHDFFTSYREELFDDPHTFAATTCVIYRGLSAIDSRDDLDEGSLEGLTEDYAFMEYAFRYLGHHTQQSTLLHEGRLPHQVNQFLSVTGPQSLFVPMDPWVWEWFFDSGNVAHIAAFYGLLRWFEENPDNSIVNGLSIYGATPLMYACAGGHASVVEFLLGTGKVDIHALTICTRVEPYSALDFAVELGHIDIVKILLKSGAPINRGPQSPTLARAAEFRHTGIIRLFLSHPACQTNLDNILNQGVLHHAVFRGNIEAVELLAAFPGVDINSCCQVDGASIRTFTHPSNTPLVHAIERHDTQVARLLLEAPAIDHNARSSFGLTALHTAAGEGMDEVLNALLRIPDIEINTEDNAGRTALHYACGGKDTKQCLTPLIQSGKMYINAKDMHGWTPLHYASSCGNAECVRVLLSCGSTPKINEKTHARPPWKPKDIEDVSTALDLALKLDHTEVVSLLEGAGALRAADVQEADGLGRCGDNDDPDREA